MTQVAFRFAALVPAVVFALHQEEEVVIHHHPGWWNRSTLVVVVVCLMLHRVGETLIRCNLREIITRETHTTVHTLLHVQVIPQAMDQDGAHDQFLVRE